MLPYKILSYSAADICVKLDGTVNPLVSSNLLP